MPSARGIAPIQFEIAPEGQRPSAHQAAQPLEEFRSLTRRIFTSQHDWIINIARLALSVSTIEQRSNTFRKNLEEHYVKKNHFPDVPGCAGVRRSPFH
jgi:hypothetical protein